MKKGYASSGISHQPHVGSGKINNNSSFVADRAPITMLTSRTAKILPKEAQNLDIVAEIDTKPPNSDDGDTI
ncbi:MAG: hypothetical protein KA007_01705 [Candidatus Pacebacteria bacterium]|jgi:hypothetical protein|nr:hypothetical protein [Candidatus Paceibacterota bacterium]